MNRPKRQWRRRAAPLLVFGLLLGLLGWANVFEHAEGGAYALGMRLSAPRHASERFAAVIVDAEAARAAGEWPWPGPRLAALLDRLTEADVQAVAWMMPSNQETSPAVAANLDRLFELTEGNADAGSVLTELRERLDPNASLVSAFQRNGAVILGVGEEQARPTEAAARLLMPRQLQHVAGKPERLSLPGSFRPPAFPPLEMVRNGFDAPEPLAFQPGGVPTELLAVAPGVGLLPPPDSAWRQPLAWRVNGVYLPSLPLLMAGAARGDAPADLLVYKGHGVAMANDWLPTTPHLEALPYFHAPDGPGAVDRFAAEKILDSDTDISSLRDRVVVVGVEDGTRVRTPMGEMIAPVAVAQSAASLYTRDVYRLPSWSGWLAFALWGAVFAWLLLAVPRLRTHHALIGSATIAFTLAGVEMLLLISQSLWLPLMSPVVALLLGHAVLNAHRWLQERRLAQARAVSDAYLALAEALRVQGQLDRAFDALQHCVPGDTVERELHDLGLDYERKRHYAKALRVYERLKSVAPRHPEIDTRINRLRSLEEQSLRSRRSGPIDTAAMDEASTTPRIGRYDVLRELGRGAMGVVYLGRDSRIGREVAIKTMAFGDEFSGEALDHVKERFYREAQAAGRLSHPNIVTIYDVGEEDDLAYLAMDYLRGESLEHHAKEGKLLPIEQVLAIGAHVAEALHYAHAQGVVHRDVKPANMVLTGDEHAVKVTDFGVAHLSDASKTRTGTILGSPSFMSPEQVAGRRVDGRSDLWSLGVTLYQLLSGQLPFTGEPLATLMYRIANEPPYELRGWNPDLPDCVEAIIVKALQKDPAQRYQTGRGMAGALRQCMQKLAGKPVANGA